MKTKPISNCKFCGHPAKVIPFTFGDSRAEEYTVACTGPKEHSLNFWDEDPNVAVDYWNETPEEKAIKGQHNWVCDAGVWENYYNCSKCLMRWKVNNDDSTSKPPPTFGCSNHLKGVK